MRTHSRRQSPTALRTASQFPETDKAASVLPRPSTSFHGHAGIGDTPRGRSPEGNTNRTASEAALVPDVHQENPTEPRRVARTPRCLRWVCSAQTSPSSSRRTQHRVPPGSPSGCHLSSRRAITPALTAWCVGCARPRGDCGRHRGKQSPASELAFHPSPV